MSDTNEIYALYIQETKGIDRAERPTFQEWLIVRLSERDSLLREALEALNRNGLCQCWGPKCECGIIDLRFRMKESLKGFAS